MMSECLKENATRPVPPPVRSAVRTLMPTYVRVCDVDEDERRETRVIDFHKTCTNT